jgi:hypothetical protein
LLELVGVVDLSVMDEAPETGSSGEMGQINQKSVTVIKGSVLVSNQIDAKLADEWKNTAEGTESKISQIVSREHFMDT